MIKILILLLSLMLSSPVAAQPAKGAYVLYDFSTEQYLISRKHSERRSIASITKLFTAAVVLDSGVDLSQKIVVQGSSNGRFPKGSTATRLDLLKASLISSDNRATESLALAHPGGYEQFLTDVQIWLIKHSLLDTEITDSTGLMPTNISSPEDLIELTRILAYNPVIRSISSTRQTLVYAVHKGKKIQIPLKNTNPDLFTRDNILISKTGFTNPAGRCVLMLVKQDHVYYAVVVLGQETSHSRSRLVTFMFNENRP